jgi:hypothetical protein
MVRWIYDVLVPISVYFLCEQYPISIRAGHVCIMERSSEFHISSQAPRAEPQPDSDNGRLLF